MEVIRVLMGVGTDRSRFDTPSGERSLGVSLCKRMEKISYWERRETKGRTPEVEVMTSAMFESPMHPKKEVKSFGDMSKHDHHQTSCAE
jgi:hypothetical protein